MSSQTDIQALHAKVARLQVTFEVVRQQYASRLEVKRQQSASRIVELEDKVTNLEIEKRLSTLKPDHRTFQPAVSTASLEPTLRAEISRLQEVVTARDATIAQQHDEKSVLLRNMRIRSEMLQKIALLSAKMADDFGSMLGDFSEEVPKVDEPHGSVGAAEDRQDSTINTSHEESSAQASEIRELSPKTQEDIEETD